MPLSKCERVARRKDAEIAELRAECDRLQGEWIKAKDEANRHMALYSEALDKLMALKQAIEMKE